ncbi:pulmonary surfactant-associated protein A1-like isoform 4, partial [Aphelenchoides avenae]
LLTENGVDRAYIGLLYDPATCTWNWDDGSEVDYANWGPGEPNNWRGLEYCVELHTSKIYGHIYKWIYYTGRWNDVHCTNQLRAVCQKKC